MLIFRIKSMEERPLECTLCKRKANIVYKEVKNGRIDSCRMCSMCPVLQAKIGVPVDATSSISKETDANPECLHCQTSLQDLTVGGSIGCSKCYETFEEFLTKELTETNAIPLKPNSFVAKEKSIPLHLGSTPEILHNIDATNKLKSLHSALREALTFENYERAASLRDQIKILTEKLYGKERKAS